jgi:hypothetical protein
VHGRYDFIRLTSAHALPQREDLGVSATVLTIVCLTLYALDFGVGLFFRAAVLGWFWLLWVGLGVAFGLVVVCAVLVLVLLFASVFPCLYLSIFFLNYLNIPD